MKKIAVLYHSGMGHTTKIAEAVARGASLSETEVSVLSLQGSDIVEGRYNNEEVFQQLDFSDAIIFGSPTYMGMVSGQFKCFADATSERWLSQTWAGKVAAGFTVSGSPSGDKEGTLMYLSVLAAQHGMIWIGNNVIPFGDEQQRNRLGAFLGVMGQAGFEDPSVAPNEADQATGEYLGKRVAEFVLKLPT